MPQLVLAKGRQKTEVACGEVRFQNGALSCFSVRGMGFGIWCRPSNASGRMFTPTIVGKASGAGSTVVVQPHDRYTAQRGVEPRVLSECATIDTR
jgi:hypothetical protein